jgi:hypothetical protein
MGIFEDSAEAALLQRHDGADGQPERVDASPEGEELDGLALRQPEPDRAAVSRHQRSDRIDDDLADLGGSAPADDGPGDLGERGLGAGAGKLVSIGA